MILKSKRHLLHNRILLKTFLSLFAIWHIFSIFVLPDPDSVLYHHLTNSVVRYGNLIGFNNTWRFFSPNPLIRLLEYDIFTRGQNGQLHFLLSGRYPRSFNQEPNREIYNRKLDSGMYLMMQNKVPVTIGRVLCRQYANADTIAIYLRGREFPPIEKANLAFEGNRVTNLGDVVRQYMFDIHCADLRGNDSGAAQRESD